MIGWKKRSRQKDKIAGNEPPVYTKFVWVSTLAGTPVTNPKGETLAAIADVVLTRHPLHVAYLVLKPGGSAIQQPGPGAFRCRHWLFP